MSIMGLGPASPDSTTNPYNARVPVGSPRKSSRSKSVLPDEDDVRTVQWAEEKFQTDKKNRVPFENQWYMNMAFYFGKQYLVWSPQFATASGMYSRLYEPQAPPWRVRLVTNKIRSIIRKEHAQLTKENPEPYVLPATTDDDDLAAARAAETVFEFIWNDLHCRRKLRQAIHWMTLTGTGFLKDWVNPLETDSSGQPGKIEVDMITPFHIYAPLLDEQDIEHQPHVTQVMSKTTDWVQETYGVDVEPDGTTGANILEAKFLSALGLQSITGLKTVTVKEMWVKKSAMFPEGGVIIWAGDSTPLLVSDGFPYEHGEYPFTKLSHIPTGRFYAESVITDLIPIQKEYNRTRSQLIESKNRMARPQLVAPQGSVDPNKMTTEPGLIIFYRPGYTPPSALKMEPIPSYVIEELNRCTNDMADIAFQHEVSKANAPPGVTAATAISYLQEQDDTSLANSVSSIEEGVEKVGKHILEHVQQFWVMERTVRVIGAENQYEAYKLSQADILGNTDLKIQAGSAAPRSRAGKQAFITQMGQLGWIPPDRALRYMDMAETGRLYEEMQVDARQAQRENLKMMDGQSTQVNTWDEHEVHIQEHNNERKKQKFESAPDEIKMFFEQHVQQHQQVIAANAAKMAGLSGAIPGPGPGGLPGMGGPRPPGIGGPPGMPGPGRPNAPRPVSQQVRLPSINPMQQPGG